MKYTPKDAVKPIFTFIGHAIVDGKEIEVSFKTDNIKIDDSNRHDPLIIIRPLRETDGQFFYEIESKWNKLNVLM